MYTKSCEPHFQRSEYPVPHASGLTLGAFRAVAPPSALLPCQGSGPCFYHQGQGDPDHKGDSDPSTGVAENLK